MTWRGNLDISWFLVKGSSGTASVKTLRKTKISDLSLKVKPARIYECWAILWHYHFYRVWKKKFFWRLISFHHNHARSIILQPKHSKRWNQNSTFLELGFWNGQSRSVSTDSLSVWRRERDLRGLAKFKMSRTRMQVLKLVHSFGFVFFFLLLLLFFFFCSTVCAEDDAELT